MMNTMTFKTPWVRSSGWAKGLALLALAAAGWAASTGTAQARDNVYWSIGVNSPGVAVGVSNAPVYHQPYVIQHQPVIVHQPYPYGYVRPVVVAPAPVYYYPGRGYGPRWDDRRDWRHDRRHDRRDWRHDRHDRHDDDRRGRGHDHR
ncbi:hypothetical protein [Hydrogenophaga sp.]|jgi:hypothetical protein|uniref:hypothetical protein n=2 Tax=Hydrogenophaga sp. TaxID=1904254 RepID=UPI00272FD47E|nr:hypothetical protein [Hydrogenophaga sp.]